MDKQQSEEMRVIWSILGGFGGVLAIGLLLYPIVRLVIDTYFEIHLSDYPPDYWRKYRFIVEITAIMWGMIAGAGGGLASSLISVKKEFRNVLLFMGIGISLLIVFTGKDLRMEDLLFSLIFFTFLIGGAMAGCYWGMRIKSKRKSKG